MGTQVLMCAEKISAGVVAERAREDEAREGGQLEREGAVVVEAKL